MTQAVYLPYKQSILAADTNVSLNVDTTTDGPYCALLNTTSYVYSSAHQFYISLIGSPDAVVGTDQRLTTPTVTNGTFDGSDLTYTAVTGPVIGAFAIYRHNSGANSTWRLVLYEDSGVTGLPVTPNGGNITITWNASGVFTISSRLYKADIETLGYFGPAEIVRYRYLHEKHSRFGLIAEQVETFAPQAVREVHGIKHVDYSAALAIAAGSANGEA